MTKKIAMTKRDREKLKEEKRKDKQKRKEERLSSGTRSFDEMIAYVDENGMLHDTPPERQREEIDASTIATSVMKQEDIVDDAPLNGRVEHFNSSKGYGFIKDINSQEKYFFHITAAPVGIAEGDKVTFETEKGTRGMNAVRISIIK